MTRFRAATEEDLPAIIAMLADDALGRTREVVSDPVDRRYAEAFRAIVSDDRQVLAVAVDEANRVMGCIQITFIPGLSRLGMWRGQIESVRIATEARGRGLGSEMVGWAIESCRQRGCQLVQLTSDKRREDALRFYGQLGFEASHEGFKLSL